MEFRNFLVFSYTSLFFWAAVALGNVVLIGNNVTISFNDIQASFAPRVKGSGECGVLYLAEPLDACSTLETGLKEVNGVVCSPYVLIIRGGCSFEDKVKSAQTAGFKAAIVYNNQEKGPLIAMAGNSYGIEIHAVFVSSSTGKALKNYTNILDMELWLIPGSDSMAWSILAISLIFLLAMSAILATCFFVRRHRIRRERPRSLSYLGYNRMSSGLIKAMPSLIFTSILEDNSTSSACAICLENYNVGEKLRILPCRHKFHSLCVDSWLSRWRTFCPICKRDASNTATDSPVSETTPLLSSNSLSILAPIASSSAPSSARSPQPSYVTRTLSTSCPVSFPRNSPPHFTPTYFLPLHYMDSAAARFSAQSLPGC